MCVCKCTCIHVYVPERSVFASGPHQFYFSGGSLSLSSEIHAAHVARRATKPRPIYHLLGGVQSRLECRLYNGRTREIGRLSSEIVGVITRRYGNLFSVEFSSIESHLNERLPYPPLARSKPSRHFSFDNDTWNYDMRQREKVLF